MQDHFSVISANKLLEWILEEYKSGTIFGISKDLFFKPSKKDLFKFTRYDQGLETPIGVAAGPHTQMAQNIISAWLSGARYIELKTVQTLDQLNVSKPCIDIEDEGYNCEWSQELLLTESFNEYLKAWVIIHLLKHKFGWGYDPEPGFIFNMSVGYNLEGILKRNVQTFLDKMNNCREEKEKLIESLSVLYPGILKINIPDKISNNVTLSTMHGCPPEEIEKIARYLIEEKKLHTTIKLNPTLLGAESLRNILNTKLGYDATVPDEAFEHDLKYPDAINIINNLKESAKKNNVAFGLKLTNTLEVVNHRDVFPENEKMMYMSGRALHPISINLAKKLQENFDGELDISFSAGADCFNISDVLSCGLKPVTVCSDILKPGGYGRLLQYLDILNTDMKLKKVKSIDEFIKKKSNLNESINKSIIYNLTQYSSSVLRDKKYSKNFIKEKNIKTTRALPLFDCIKAPCVETCPTNQDVPDYMYLAAKGNYKKALEVILKTNPLPTVTGMVCDHLCMTKCTRQNYDMPLMIRDIKRFIVENSGRIKLKPAKCNNIKIAVIGAGPSGLSFAYYLAMHGFVVNVYESAESSGGMVSNAIPGFRLTDEQITKDINRILSLGVKIHYNQKVDRDFYNELKKDNKYIYIGIGAQKNKEMGIEGENLNNVFGALDFLYQVRKKGCLNIGKKIAVIGGGNSAMDAARTAYRLVDKDGEIVLLYRRTINEMPADKEELNAIIEEGINIIELTAPLSISNQENKLILECIKMKLGELDSSGRKRPVKIDGSEFEMKFDTIISAIGQDIETDFFDFKNLEINSETNETQVDNVYIGGDVLHGALNIVTAIGDGKKAAKDIIKKSGIEYKMSSIKIDKKFNISDYQNKSIERVWGEEVSVSNLSSRKNFNIVINSLDNKTALKEASRCLYCNDICNICVSVCPNRANISYTVKPVNYQLYNFIKDNGISRIVKGNKFIVNQKYQIINIADFCNECGNCNTFCPTSGAPYIDKPKICLTRRSYDVNKKAMIIYKKEQVEVIESKENDQIERLFDYNDYYLYESGNTSIKLNKSNFEVLDYNVEDGITTENAVILSVFLESLKNYMKVEE